MTEKQLHYQICQWIKIQHPEILFTSSMDGFKLSKGLAIQASKLRSCKGWPDIMIFAPRGEYHGLFLEVKKDRKEIYKHNGEFKTPHIEEQALMIQKLKDIGYYASFVYSLDMAIDIINCYLCDI